MRRVWPLALLLMVTGCATVAERAYYPNPADPETRVLAEALWRAAKAASDDPGEYSFAMIRTSKVSAYTVEDATFYFTQGPARQPAKIIDALVAHEVAHEVLGHIGSGAPCRCRRAPASPCSASRSRAPASSISSPTRSSCARSRATRRSPPI